MKNDTMRQILTIVATVATIAANSLAVVLPLNNLTSQEISDSFDVLFTPAGYVFSIWGVIYLVLIIYSIYQALPAQRDNEALRAISPWYLLASVANIAWIFLWHYQVFGLTIVAMITLLIALLKIYLTLNIGLTAVKPGMKWAVHLPFSIYLGWITVATIANVTALLWLAEWNGLGISPEIWTAIMLVVAVLVAAGMALNRADWAFCLVLAWAFSGIVVENQEISQLVATSATIATVITALLAVISAWPRGPLPLR